MAIRGMQNPPTTFIVSQRAASVRYADRILVLEDGELAASFPSSHTLLAICLFGIAAHQLYLRIRSHLWRWIAAGACAALAAVTVIGRLLSGVHWLTDILGGILLGGAILLAYLFAVKAVNKS